MEHIRLKVAVYAFFIREGNILLSRRLNTGWQDGNFGLPSGHLEQGETLTGALIREMKEEVGIKIVENNIKFVHIMNRQTNYISIFFLIENWLGEPQNMEPEKCSEIKWFDINNLPENMVPSVKFAIENYQKGILLSDFNQEG
jgi:mutator protein MutT